METIRVALWGTGKVGKLALRGVLDNPALELVAVHAYSAEKAGRDAGALCDRADTGVLATADIAAVIAARPDVVVYTPFTGDVDDCVRLLEAGIDILSTNLFFHVGGIRGEVRERLQAAGERGDASIYITGINPGWINSVTAAVTGVCARVDRVWIAESADCSTYESPETWNYLRMGQRGVDAETIETARTWLVMFKDAAERVADSLGLVLEETVFSCDYATAAERVDLGWFVLEAGTNAAVRGRWDGKIGGVTRVRTEITWYLTRLLADEWEIADEEYNVRIDGAPDVRLRIAFGDPAPSALDGDWSGTATTAYAAINAIAQIVAARPGVLSLHDIGLPYAPVGEWESRGGSGWGAHATLTD